MSTTTTHSRPPYVPQIRLYQDWLRDQRGLSFASYHELWRWSITDLDAFWQSIWDYFQMQSPTPHTAVLARNVMPGAVWFPGAQTNYAHQVLRHVQPAHAAGFAAVISRNEKGQHREISWPELRRQVASMALHLQAQGVQPGDRVAAYLPNIPEAMVAFLATVSIGGVWSICAPDMGTNAVLDRFRQIAPKALTRAISDPDPARAGRAMQAMMKKLVTSPMAADTPLASKSVSTSGLRKCRRYCRQPGKAAVWPKRLGPTSDRRWRACSMDSPCKTPLCRQACSWAVSFHHSCSVIGRMGASSCISAGQT